LPDLKNSCLTNSSDNEVLPTTLGFVSLLASNMFSAFELLSAFVPADGMLSSFAITSIFNLSRAKVQAGE
jgi:hypothetical protein